MTTPFVVGVPRVGGVGGREPASYRRRRGYERLTLRAIHPTIGGATVVLNYPPGRAIYVKKRTHHDQPLRKPR